MLDDLRISLLSHDSLARPRAAVTALVSLATLGTAGYLLYRHHYPELDEQELVLTGGGLHRRNAIRRRRPLRRESRAGSPRPSTSSSQDQNEAPEGDDEIRHLHNHAHDGETVVDDGQPPWFEVETPPRHGHNIVNLLFRVSEDNSRRNASVHRGCQCNVCGIAPIRGIRYRCANCADFDLCESCESQGLHIKTHVFYKVKVPAPPPGLRQMQPVWYTGDPDSVTKSLSRTLISKLAKETGFERPELEAYWEQWTFMANTEWRDDPDGLQLAMDRKTFERCLITSGGSRHTAPNLLHDRMFAFYDTNKDGLIGFAEFLHGLSYRQRKDRLKKVFEGYDINGDGYIDRKDCLRMFRAYYVLYKQMHKDVLDQLDEQAMSSTEVQTLAAGRQPISSLFGRELHRMPLADPPPPMLEGKIRSGNGEVDLAAPGRANVVKEANGDIEYSRKDILTRLIWEDMLDEDNPFSSRHYSSTLFAPIGMGTEEIVLPSVEAEIREGEGFGSSGNADNTNGGGENGNNITAEASESLEEQLVVEASSSDGSSDDYVPMSTSNRVEVEYQLGHMSLRIPGTSSDRWKEIRREVRRRLYDRWVRRQFYVDEEEGFKQPRRWDEEDDILTRTMEDLRATNGKQAEAGECEPSHMSPRSRSSSKVRFATDSDEWEEIMSSPSGRSRSVPERWGGMDIPDSERDAGKEIMYQIAQQAFNEMIDPLFKGKEDLAVRVAQTRKQRQKYADRIAALPGKEEAAEESSTTPIGEEKTPTKQMSINDVLVKVVGEGAGIAWTEMDAATEEEAEVDYVVSEEGTEEHRDPTMPQFRPNGAMETTSPSQAGGTGPGPSTYRSPRSLSTPSHNKTGDKRLSSKAKGKKPARRSKSAGHNDDDDNDDNPVVVEIVSHRQLYEWRSLNEAEAEARKRGGFGRLDYDEFEAVYKNHESRGSRFDYLGSWIDFCIP